MSVPIQAGLRDKILVEATKLFVTSGYNGISMREIAEAAGLSKAGLYYHFKDKEDLFLAILSDNLDQIYTIVQSCCDGELNIRERIKRLVRAIFSQSPEERAIIRLASQEMANLSPKSRAEFDREYHEKFIGQISNLFRDAMDHNEIHSTDPELLTWVLLGMMYPFFGPTLPEHRTDSSLLIETILSVFFDGITVH